MSETPSQSTTSPQKRSNDDTQLNDSKRPKTSVEASTDLESFDINDFDLPQSTDIQNQFNLDLPDLPGESPSTTNIGRSPSVPQQTITQNENNNNNNTTANKNNKDTDENGLQKPSGTAEDPDKLSDALLSAGVDLKAEEALLTSTVNSLPTKQNGEQIAANAVQQPIIINTPFLDPRQVATFMSKVANANGIKQSFDNEVHSPILQLMTNACEEWMTNIVTNAVILSRHRRRSIRQRKRSEISKALREVAVQQKSQEDKRQQKRKNLGIDQEEQSKLGTEETQHKATNATVAMMTAGKKKKYSWMTGGGAGSGGSKASSGSVDGGIRFREAREEPGIAVRDLLSSLEKKRHGVEKVITKGYSKLKD
ncbi:unnamed protein product [Wickerhamomyces anomalus]